MKDKPKYLWQVTHDAFGSAEVEARDKYEAVLKACALWEQRWTRIARDCGCVRLRKAAKP